MLLLSAVNAQSVKLASSYYCITHDAVGFALQEGKWQSVRFDVSRNKYRLRVTREGDTGFDFNIGKDYVLFERNHSTPHMKCVPSHSGLRCESYQGQLDFSPRTGRFNYRGKLGYWLSHDGNESGDLKPFTAIGTCAPK